MSEIVWKTFPILAGLERSEAVVQLHEKPGAGWPPVATKATASVAPDFDWRTNGVLWGVTFHRYTPKRPLEPREKRNETTGVVEKIPPPPIIPERKVGGRVPVQGEEIPDLRGAILAARHLAELAIRAGRAS